jgi:hypothetical protein
MYRSSVWPHRRTVALCFLEFFYCSAPNEVCCRAHSSAMSLHVCIHHRVVSPARYLWQLLTYRTACVNYNCSGAHGVRAARGLGDRGRRGLAAEGGRHVPVPAREHGRAPGDVLQAVRSAAARLAGNILCTFVLVVVFPRRGDIVIPVVAKCPRTSPHFATSVSLALLSCSNTPYEDCCAAS